MNANGELFQKLRQIFGGGGKFTPPPPGIGLTPMLPRINPIPGGVFEGFFIFILAHEDMR